MPNDVKDKREQINIKNRGFIIKVRKVLNYLNSNSEFKVGLTGYLDSLVNRDMEERGIE